MLSAGNTSVKVSMP